jgi:Protein of unknown function (DUF732)
MMVARHNITKLVGTAIAVAALGVTTPGTAAAYTTTDLAFLHRLFADGVNFGQTDDILQRARSVCDGFGAGDSPAEVHAAVLTNSEFTARQAAVFMADAVQFYCPGYSDQFIS